MEIDITKTDSDPVEERKIELVERKGIGHPDSICDGIAESVSRELSKEYRERFGEILHHNTDEVQLVAGESSPEFGLGEIITPMYILLTGRATKQFDGEKIPVDSIALKAAKEYIRENFKILEPSMIEFESRIGETSTDLESVYNREEVLSNDTSFGVGHAPYSRTEKAVKNIDKEVRGLYTSGEDVKVMGLRRNDRLTVTVASAAISERVESMDDYIEHREEIKKIAETEVKKQDLEPEIYVNTADDLENKEVYLTVTGTSAEMGDDGSVGRGNRVNGLITPHRSMSMEASSGKNPVTHVGKIYNLLSHEIADEIHSKTGSYAHVKLLAQIGAPINDPALVEVETEASRDEITEIIERNLEEIKSVTEKCVDGKLQTF